MSTYPVVRTAVNESFPLANMLVTNASEFRSLQQKIASKSLELFGTRRLNAVQKQCLMTHLLEEEQSFNTLITVATTLEKPQQVAPPAPARKELYGRIADGEQITDVGAGDINKLKTQSGRLHITAVDPKLMPTDVTVKIQPTLEVGHISGIVTSFNVLPQLDPDSVAMIKINNSDGLHVIPDHDYLLEAGCAVREKDRVHVQTRTLEGEKMYHDFYMHLPGYPVDGYKICPVYELRSIHLPVPRPPSEPGDGSGTNYFPKIQASPGSPADANWKDMGWKYDGDPYELETFGGNIFLTARNGFSIKVEYPCEVRMCLHLEYVESCACFVLLRVVMYNGFIPPHSGDLLRYFCERVNIMVGGLPVLGPLTVDVVPVLNGSVAPVDGIVSRDQEKDYYFKKTWTVDFYPHEITRANDTAVSQGWGFICESIRAGLHEYSVLRSAGVVTLRPVRVRYDKNHSTAQSTFERMLSLPTLTEVMSLYGPVPQSNLIQSWC